MVSRQVYNLAYWTKSGMTYWAVSDLNSSELQEFVQLVQNQTSQQCDLHRVRINDAGDAGHAGDIVPGGSKFAGNALLPHLVARVSYLTTIAASA